MSTIAEKKDPALWDEIKAEVTASDKGGKPGQWSARKAQLATHEYQARGGTYKGRKDPENHLQHWSEEEWGTKSGHPSDETGERYLPKAARDHLTPAEYKRTTAKKRADTRKGLQHSAQPEDIARKTAADRDTGHPAPPASATAPSPTKASLMAKARERNVPGRSRMSKAELEKAVA